MHSADKKKVTFLINLTASSTAAIAASAVTAIEVATCVAVSFTHTNAISI